MSTSSNNSALEKTSDLHVVETRPLIPPSRLHNDIPLDHASANTVSKTRRSIQNNLHHNYRKQLFSVYGAPSSGSTTESFLKSKALNSPVYRHNEMSTKYNMISSVPMKLYTMQKSIDLFVWFFKSILNNKNILNIGMFIARDQHEQKFDRRKIWWFWDKFNFKQTKCFIKIGIRFAKFSKNRSLRWLQLILI